MDTAYRIRPAVAADIERVVALDREIQNVPHWRVVDYLAALPPVERVEGVTGTRRCFFVAESGVALVGFAVGQVTVLDTDVLAELESVGVAESVRRAGIGRALCEAVILWARECGAKEIELEVRSRSEGAIALYRGIGFVTVGMRAKYYREPGDDAVLMRLGLDGKANATADSLRE
jgi:ribosomal-protein-alanine N-acetyltransferase